MKYETEATWALRNNKSFKIWNCVDGKFRIANTKQWEMDRSWWSGNYISTLQCVICGDCDAWTCHSFTIFHLFGLHQVAQNLWKIQMSELFIIACYFLSCTFNSMQTLVKIRKGKIYVFTETSKTSLNFHMFK
jgi:hypothetical protein